MFAAKRCCLVSRTIVLCIICIQMEVPTCRADVGETLLPDTTVAVLCMHVCAKQDPR